MCFKDKEYVLMQDVNTFAALFGNISQISICVNTMGDVVTF